VIAADWLVVLATLSLRSDDVICPDQAALIETSQRIRSLGAIVSLGESNSHIGESLRFHSCPGRFEDFL
jgi:hypothetical protein